MKHDWMTQIKRIYPLILEGDISPSSSLYKSGLLGSMIGQVQNL